ARGLYLGVFRDGFGDLRRIPRKILVAGHRGRNVVRDSPVSEGFDRRGSSSTRHRQRVDRALRVLDGSLVHVVVTVIAIKGGQMRIARMCSFGFGILMVSVSLGSVAMAGTNQVVPEIDGSSVTAALGLLAAGILLVRARKNR